MEAYAAGQRVWFERGDAKLPATIVRPGPNPLADPNFIVRVASGEEYVARPRDLTRPRADRPIPPESPLGRGTLALQAKSGLKRNPDTGKMEKVSTRTGLTSSQSDFLAQEIAKGVRKLQSEQATHPGQTLGERLTVKIPGDGEFRFSTTEQANAVYRGISGKPLSGFPEPESFPSLTRGKAKAIVEASDPYKMALSTYGTTEAAAKALRSQLDAIKADPQSYPDINTWEVEDLISQLEEGRKHIDWRAGHL